MMMKDQTVAFLASACRPRQTWLPCSSVVDKNTRLASNIAICKLSYKAGKRTIALRVRKIILRVRHTHEIRR
jgi:hypothetical protein